MYFEKVLHSAKYHTRPEKRMEMICILGKLGDDRALDALRVISSESDPFIVSQAAEAIGMIGGNKALEILKTLIDHPSFIVRGKVALALGMIDHPERDYLLMRMLNDMSQHVISHVQHAQRSSLNSSSIQRSLKYEVLL